MDDDARTPWSVPPTLPPTVPPTPYAVALPLATTSVPSDPPASVRSIRPRRPVSRWLVVALLVSALAVVGAYLSLRSATHDRTVATSREAAAQSGFDDEQAAGVSAHDDLSDAVSSGRGLDAALDKPVATIQQLNAVDEDTAGLMATQLTNGEAGIRGEGAYNRTVDALNAEVDQSNALATQLQNETDALPTD